LGRLSFTPAQGTIECVKEDCCWASSLLARPWHWQWQRQLLLPRRWSEFLPGSQRFCRELRCRPLMTMALDVVASLGLATDDAKAMNFAGLCCLVRGSVIAGAPRAIRKGRRLSGMLDELGGCIQGGTQNGPAPTKMLIHLEGAHAFLCEHLRWSWAPSRFRASVF
jgi:hypothetical protein